eukprot:jgi/Psemu1/326698/estExt_fgenesh1_pg.C_4470009
MAIFLVYFACKVLRKGSESSPTKSRFYVQYEDDSKNWHDLAITKFRWQEAFDNFLDDEAEEDTAADCVDGAVEDGQDSGDTPSVTSENNDEEEENPDDEDEGNPDDEDKENPDYEDEGNPDYENEGNPDTNPEDASASATTPTGKKNRKRTVEPTENSMKGEDDDQDKEASDDESEAEARDDEDEDGNSTPLPKTKMDGNASAKNRRKEAAEISKDSDKEEDDDVDQDPDEEASDDGKENENPDKDEDSNPRPTKKAKKKCESDESARKEHKRGPSSIKDPAEQKDGDKYKDQEASDSGGEDESSSKQPKKKVEGKSVATVSTKEKREEAPDRGPETDDDGGENKEEDSIEQAQKKEREELVMNALAKKLKGHPVTTEAEEDDNKADDGGGEDENENTPRPKKKSKTDTTTDASTAAKKTSPKKKRKGTAENTDDSTDEKEADGGAEDRDSSEDRGQDAPEIKGDDKNSTNQPKEKAKTETTSDSSESEIENSNPSGSNRSWFLSKKSTVEDIQNACEEKKISKENALLSVMMIHYMAGTTTLTFGQLAEDLGYNSKNQALVLAWKAIRKDKLVEEEGNKRGKRILFRLTCDGIDLIAPKGFHKKDPPTTTEQIYERIKSGAINEHCVTIFEELLRSYEKGVSMSRAELATACGVSAKTKAYSQAFQQLNDNGYVISDSKKSKFVLSEKCFLD